MLFMLLDELPSFSDDKGVYEVLSKTVIQCNASAAVCGGKAFGAFNGDVNRKEE